MVYYIIHCITLHFIGLSRQNVCKYVRKTREFAETVPGSHVTFVSNNAYE